MSYLGFITKTNLGKGLFGFHILSQSSLREVEAGIWRQKLKQQPRRSTVYWTVSPGLLSWLLYHSGLSSQSTQPTVGWDLTVDESGPGPTGQSTGATFSVKFPCLKWLQLSSSWQKTRQERWQSVAFTFNRGARKSPDNTAHLYRPTILHLYLQKKGMFI